MENINSLRTKQLIIKYITSVIILGVTAIFAPNFNFESFPILLLSAFVIVILDYLVSTLTCIHDEPFGRSVVGFVSFTIIIYMTQFIVCGYYITILSSIIAAAIYGIIDYFIPNKE